MMSSPVASRSQQGSAIDAYVIEAELSLNDAARRVAEGLPHYDDDRLGEECVQAAISRALSVEVPGWDAWVSTVMRRFNDDGVVLVRGLRFDAENRLLIGSLAPFGRLTGAGNPGLRVVYDLVPIERPPDTPDFELFFHTGSYFRSHPHEVLALQCVQPGSAGGGVSKIAVLDTVLDMMRDRGNAAAIDLLLQTPVLFKRPIRKGRGYFEAPIFSRRAGQPGCLEVRYERRRVERGASGRGPDGYGAELQAAIDAFEAAAYTPGTSIEYALQADELLIIDNRRVLHARTAVVGGAASGRHLKRVKAFLR